MSRDLNIYFGVTAASKTRKGLIMSAHAFNRLQFLDIVLLAKPDGTKPEIQRYTVGRGELTAHDILDFCEVAVSEADAWKRTNKLLTKDDLISAADWYYAGEWDSEFWITSPSLGVTLWLSEDATLVTVQGCLIRHGRQHLRPRVEERWGTQMVARILRQIAVRTLRQRHHDNMSN